MRRAAWDLLRRPALASEGNRVDLHIDGDEAFRAMWRAIRAARRRVWLETYFLAADGVGRHTLTLLARAARRGCDVCVTVDAVGSLGLPDEALGELRKAGGRVLRYNPPFLVRLPPQVRDHRKLLIADDVAFLGGRNFGDDYAGVLFGSGRSSIVPVSFAQTSIMRKTRTVLATVRSARSR